MELLEEEVEEVEHQVVVVEEEELQEVVEEEEEHQEWKVGLECLPDRMQEELGHSVHPHHQRVSDQ